MIQTLAPSIPSSLAAKAKSSSIGGNGIVNLLNSNDITQQ